MASVQDIKTESISVVFFIFSCYSFPILSCKEFDLDKIKMLWFLWSIYVFHE